MTELETTETASQNDSERAIPDRPSAGQTPESAHHPIESN